MMRRKHPLGSDVVLTLLLSCLMFLFLVVHAAMSMLALLPSQSGSVKVDCVSI